MALHTINLYQKPKVGNNLIRRYLAYNYKHKISAVGGFDTCSFNLALPRAEAEQWFDAYLGNRIAVYVDNPAEPIWEGLVSRMKWQIGGWTWSISLDQLMNRVQVQYATAADATNTTTAANDTASQAIYGIKQGTIDARIIYDANLATALRNHLIQVHAWPKASNAVSGGAGQSLFSVECVGFYHTLNWEIRADGLSALINASVVVSNAISNLANGATFINNADTSLIQTNSSFQHNRLQRNGKTAWQVMQEVQEAGDGAGTPWVMGVEPTQFGTNTRRFYYRPANLEVEYTTRLSDALRIRNKYGGFVPPWWVRPDRGIRINDMLVGWDGIGDDPRESYLEVIQYDADRQSVTWASSDNPELEGAFQLRRFFKAHGTRFGEPVRQAE